MYHSFQERPSSEDDSHQHIGRVEAVHVRQKISTILPILVVVAQVTADGDQQDHEHKGDCDHFHNGAGEGVAEEDLEGSEAEEGEILQVALDEELDQDQSEGVRSQVFADLVVEETVEHFVVDKLEGHHEGH